MDLKFNFACNYQISGWSEEILNSILHVITKFQDDQKKFSESFSDGQTDGRTKWFIEELRS